MRKCLKEWKGLGEGSVMEKAAEMATAGGRKRKVEIGESSLAMSSVQLKTRRLDMVTLQKSASSPESSGNSTCESVGSDQFLSSCCSSNEWSDELVNGSSKFLDLEETESSLQLISTTTAVDSMNRRDNRRGTTPSSTSPRESNPQRRLQKIPSKDELEKFFGAAEKNLQEQFVNKYNYDIAKDKPMEGPYEWIKIQLKP